LPLLWEGEEYGEADWNDVEEDLFADRPDTPRANEAGVSVGSPDEEEPREGSRLSLRRQAARGMSAYCSWMFHRASEVDEELEGRVRGGTAMRRS
jgi:hypothetical protein